MKRIRLGFKNRGAVLGPSKRWGEANETVIPDRNRTFEGKNGHETPNALVHPTATVLQDGTQQPREHLSWLSIWSEFKTFLE
jgi:hypothetical protein